MQKKTDVSVLVTTKNRQHLLPYVVEMFQAQTAWNRGMTGELVIVDVSDQPLATGWWGDDARVKYLHLRHPLSRGEGRNVAASMSTGDVLVWWDDDDFYGRWYVADMRCVLCDTGADVVLPESWSVYHVASGRLFCWSAENRDSEAFEVGPGGVRSVSMNDIHDRGAFIQHTVDGWGFRYVTTARAWTTCPWPSGPDIDASGDCEDYRWIQKLRGGGYTVGEDTLCEDAVCHISHPLNQTTSYPNEEPLGFVVPGLMDYIRRVYGA